MPLNHWIVLEDGQTCEVRELFPEQDRSRGTYKADASVELPLAAQTAMVVEIRPASGAVPGSGQPRPAGTPVDKAFLSWEEIRWNEIMHRP